MNKSQERRRALRKQCLVPVDGKQDSIFGQSQTIDLSKTGMGFFSSVSIPLQTKVAIEIELNSQGESVVVVGYVKWIRQLTGSEAYRYGVQFESPPPAVRSRLSKYLRK